MIRTIARSLIVVVNTTIGLLGIYDPATVVAAPGTVSGYTRQPFPNNALPTSRLDTVAARLVQAYPLPDIPGLANNQFTNPVLVNNYNYGNARVDWNLSNKDTAFLRFSPQRATVNTPTAFGYRTVPFRMRRTTLSVDQPECRMIRSTKMFCRRIE